MVGLGVLASLLALARFLPPPPFWPSLCGNTVISEHRSADGTWKVVVFERDCGATTHFSTQASLLRAHASLPDDSGNLIIVDDAPLQVTWTGPRSVVVRSLPGAHVFKAANRVRDVEVSYVLDADRPW
jgi:hypothetical protein